MSHALALIAHPDDAEPSKVSEPIVAAIARHRAARAAHSKAAIALDRVTTHPENQRTPMTIAAMVRADTERDAASVEDDVSWVQIWACEPETFGALMIASRYASEVAEEYDGTAMSRQAVFEYIAKNLQRLIGTLPSDLPEQVGPASLEYMAACDYTPWDEDSLAQMPTAETWPAMAASHITVLRIAVTLLMKNRHDLLNAVAKIVSDKEVGTGLLNDLRSSKEWASGMLGILEHAEIRFLAAASALSLRIDAGEDMSAVGDDALDPEIEAGKSTQRPGYVPGVPGASAAAYGLTVEADGAGLRVPPGSTVIVEPEAPRPNGLAVVYFKHGGTPRIFDLDRNFRPDDLLVAEGSAAFPLIEMIEPITGRRGRVDLRKIDKMYRVCGVYQPTEVMEKYGPMVPDLTELDHCPPGMITHRVETEAAYPILRQGETAVVDPGLKDPRDGGLFLLEWSNGTRSVLQTNLRAKGSAPEKSWWTDPVNRPRTTDLLERRLAMGGGMMFTSDGPYTEELLRTKIVGEVVGVLVRSRPGGGKQAFEAAQVPATRADETFHVDVTAPTELGAACIWAVKQRAWVDEAAKAETWTDEDTERFLGPVDTVLTRATDEPAENLQDLWGKAQIALEDLERFAQVFPESTLDNQERLFQSVFRDVIALCDPAAHAPAGPSVAA